MKTYQIKGFLGGVFIFQTKNELRVWIDGAKHALWTFAINKDGEKYVGSGGKTFKQEMEILYAQYKEATDEDYEL